VMGKFARLVEREGGLNGKERIARLREKGKNSISTSPKPSLLTREERRGESTSYSSEGGEKRSPRPYERGMDFLLRKRILYPFCSASGYLTTKTSLKMYLNAQNVKRIIKKSAESLLFSRRGGCGSTRFDRGVASSGGKGKGGRLDRSIGRGKGCRYITEGVRKIS